MKKILLYFTLLLLPFLGFAQILEEGFEDITTLEANGWTMTNLSQPVGSTLWFQGNIDVFSSHQGPGTSYIGANYNNTGSAGIISNWLITPTVEVQDGDKLSFWSRTTPESIWNDRLEVRSSQGAMTVPSGASGTGSFNNLLLVINDDYDLSYPAAWTKYEIIVAGVGTTPVAMNFAFRYSVDNLSGNESNFIGIDTVLIQSESIDPDPGEDCDAVNVPYIQDFESSAVPAMPACTSIENAGSGNNWETSNTLDGEFTGTYLSYKYHANDANAWFYTQGINLTSGTAYEITYEYGSRSGSAFPENLKVAYGSDNTHTAMTEVLDDHIGILSGATKLTNTVEFTPATTGVFYFGFNAHSDADQWYLSVDNIQIDLADGPEPEDGCLDAPFGLYPSATYMPSCIGTPELITGSFTGEYANVNVISGNEYIFSTSIETDYITISNAEGTEVYAAGTTPLTWTATNSEVVRYYLHLDDECNYNTAEVRNRMVQCGESIVIEVPDFDCYQGDGITSSFDNAYNIDVSNDFRTADDFIVESGILFTLRQITIDVNQQEVPDNAIINIREDNAGSPGDIIETVNMAPTSSIAYAAVYGDPIYHLTFDLITPLVFEEGTYWIEPKMSTPSNEYVWWLTTSTGSNGAIAQRSTDDGASWYPDPDGFQMVFFVAGDCDDTLGVKDLNSLDFAFYPNPVKDVLNIKSQKEVKSVEIFNIIGQKVVLGAKVNNGQINVSKLTTGSYVVRAILIDGQVETFKIIKK